MPDHVRELFQDTIAAVWNGFNESDGFNALVLAAGLTWRQANVLRAYAKYMRQGGTPFAQDYIEGAPTSGSMAERSRNSTSAIRRPASLIFAIAPPAGPIGGNVRRHRADIERQNRARGDPPARP